MLTCPILGGNCLYFFFIWTEKKAEYGSSCDVTLMNLREKKKKKKTRLLFYSITFYFIFVTHVYSLLYYALSCLLLSSTVFFL